MQWNAEGIYRKKTCLQQRLKEEDIHIACLQETHLNQKYRFTIRGYQTFRKDRENRSKGGVMILVKNNLNAIPFEVETQEQAEIQGVRVINDKETITIFNVYCPQDKDLSLTEIKTQDKTCLILGDFNSHSEAWGYSQADPRGEEIEEWMIDTNLQLLNHPEDTPTFYSRRWHTTSTPDLAFASGDIQRVATREVMTQLGGSDHRPIKITINPDATFSHKAKPIPRWNYKKANWNQYAELSNLSLEKVNVSGDINKVVKILNKEILAVAKQTIPRGARREYKPYWSKELQEAHDQLTKAREKAEDSPSQDHNIQLKAASAKFTRLQTQTTRDSWKNHTAGMNMDREGRKLWKLAKSLNDENNTKKQVVLVEEGNPVTGKKAADLLISSYEKESEIKVPKERIKRVKEEMTAAKTQETEIHEIMQKPINLLELNSALDGLKAKKSPGPDEITNEMLKFLGNRGKTKLLEVINLSWKTGNLPQLWREAEMIPVYKKGKNITQASSYRPISLTSSMCKVMERVINTRLTWYLEKENKIAPQQAGFRPYRSTEDQVTHITQSVQDAFQEKKTVLAVCVDMQKAFDKVWKQGLLLMLHRSGVRGRMHNWIRQYLHNRRARVRLDGHKSKKKLLREGVPQGGVLSPTLFLIFINTILDNLPPKVYGAIYADDLVLWCAEEYISIAKVRMQQALNNLETWTKDWGVTVNANKTTFTLFSLTTKPQKVTLKMNGAELKEEPNPTYLGMTLDKTMTWKPQIQRATTKAKHRLALMKKLSGTTWGADQGVLKKLYVGYTRPVMEYGMAASATSSRSNFNKLTQVQNQALRIITGGIKSTPIKAMETLTGLQTLDDRRDTKVIKQAAKFNRLEQHQMHNRMKGPIRGRLKRKSFLHIVKELKTNHKDCFLGEPQKIFTFDPTPQWKRHNFPKIVTIIPGISKKGTQQDLERKTYACCHIEENYPSDTWVQAYTDGSAKNATRDGGGGISIKYPTGKRSQHYIQTGRYSTNYRAESMAIKEAAGILKTGKTKGKKVVILTDALSVLQHLQAPVNKDTNNLVKALCDLSQHTKECVLQWIPAHCGIRGNEEADNLAKQGALLPQTDHSINFEEANAIINAHMHRSWREQHHQHNPQDSIYLLDRKSQVTIFRLRTGHNKLKHHLFNKLNIGQNDQCECGSPQTAEHVLQDCTLLNEIRNRYWPQPSPLQDKLQGNREQLQRTAQFVNDCGVSV